ncbi:MAG: tyrosine-type recombinase/integrase [Candidatus Aminicenantes bacterium]|nr:tyrosine-type recombinase/integrase [Candidatus Aminicenantes bacterium]MDH5742897.1 tyrosine-type recombinase/integrase [Candidatus Aminicenantes bacterium]
MPKGKSKTRYNLGYGAIYQRKTKGGKIRWYLDYRDANGERKQELVSNAVHREDAIVALQKKVLAEHDKKYGVERRKEKIGFKAFAEIYLQDYAMVVKKSWRADKSRLETLVKHFKDIELSKIAPSMIQRFIAWRQKEGNSKSTVNRYLALLKKMLNIAIEEGYLEQNPVTKIKFFSEKDNLKERILSDEEEKRLIEKSSDHLKSIMTIALHTGMRLGEILNLQWDQIDFQGQSICVEKTKSGRSRTIPINPLLFKELKELRSVNGQSPYVFPNPDTGKPLTTVKTGFNAACRRAGIEGLRFHDLRHTFGSRLVQKGVDIETVRSLLGHSSITITQRYVHSTDDRKKAAVDLLDGKPEKNQKSGNLLHIRYTAEDQAEEKSTKKPVNPLFSWN